MIDNDKRCYTAVIKMQEYKNMDIIQLARELDTLDDENFILIIKKLETKQLQEVLPKVDGFKMIRIVQEIGSRSEPKKAITSDNIPVQLQLALTAEDIAPTPNLLLRSNLFSASRTHGASSDPIRDFKITTYGEKTQVTLTAFRQFNQLDLDLLLELIKLQQEQKSSMLKVTLYELVKDTKGSGEGKESYLQIKEQLKLLQNASLEIKHGRYSFVGSILNNAYFDDVEHVYVIEFNPHLQPLFSNNNWTGIDTNIRKTLKTNLSKWLHGFYSSHLNSNLPIGLNTIYKLSGASDSNTRRWNSETIVKALDDLQVSFAKNGKRFSYKIEEGNLYVNKTQTVSQNKSVKNKAIKESRKKRGKQPSLI